MNIFLFFANAQFVNLFAVSDVQLTEDHDKTLLVGGFPHCVLEPCYGTDEGRYC